MGKGYDPVTCHIRYPTEKDFDPVQRKLARLVVLGGRIFEADRHTPFTTVPRVAPGAPTDHYGMFVMVLSGQFYGCKSNGDRSQGLHHSSFFAASPLACAGEIACVNGELQEITDGSGHYRPHQHNMWNLVNRLRLGMHLSPFTVRIHVGWNDREEVVEVVSGRTFWDSHGLPHGGKHHHIPRK